MPRAEHCLPARATAPGVRAQACARALRKTPELRGARWGVGRGGQTQTPPEMTDTSEVSLRRNAPAPSPAACDHRTVAIAARRRRAPRGQAAAALSCGARDQGPVLDHGHGVVRWSVITQ